MSSNMKRGPEVSGPISGGPVMKRPRANKLCIRLLIPSKVAGSIIGKAGANIQKLRTDNNASVRVPDSPGPERVMTIEAEDPDTLINVIEQSLPLMTDEAVKAGPVTDSPGGAGSSAGPSSPGLLEVRLLIHQSIVGGIIGRAGFKIKEIRDSSGSNIKVYQTCAPQSTDRCVSIQGTMDKILVAISQVLNVVNSTEIKGVDQPYDPINFDGYYAVEYGGYGTEMDVGVYGSGRNVPRNGSLSGYGMTAAAVYGGGSSSYRAASGVGCDTFSFGKSFGGKCEVDEEGEPETTQVTIPKDMAGAIIGPGGSRIRKIRSDSKATITIDEAVQGSSERIITISGTKRQIQMAQYLLQQSVREHGGPQSAAFPRF